MSKRLKCVYITDEFLSKLFSPSKELKIITKKGIPSDSTIRGISYDPTRASWLVIYEQQSFDIVQEAAVIPQAEIELKMTDGQTQLDRYIIGD